MPILSGRDPEKLGAVGDAYPGSVIRVAWIEEPASLDRALADVAAVVNCAGPFLDTAEAVIEAALRACIPYLDVTAEAAVAAATSSGTRITRGPRASRSFPRWRSSAVWAIFCDGGDGGLAGCRRDLHRVRPRRLEPDAGNATDGRAPGAHRHVFTNGRLEVRSEPPPIGRWDFPPPFGRQEVVVSSRPPTA